MPFLSRFATLSGSHDRRLLSPPVLNRELGILAFNRRVLAQAADDAARCSSGCTSSPSSRRTWTSSSRSGRGLKEQIKLGARAGPDGGAPTEVFAAVSREAHALVAEQYSSSTRPCSRRCRPGIVFPNARNGTPRSGSGSATISSARAAGADADRLDPAPRSRVCQQSLNFAVGSRAATPSAALGAAIVQAPRALAG